MPLPWVLLLLAPTASKLITLSNTFPKRDSSGHTINAHDGTIQRFGGPGAPFFYHAMGYPACNETGRINGCTSCIYGVNNSIAVWSSADLSENSWTLRSTVYPSPQSGFPACTYFRSQAVFNPATRLYVLWANVAGCSKAVPSHQSYITATAPAPEGPFSFRGFTQPSAASLGNSTTGLGDFALFVDGDGAAYAILTHGTHGAGPRDMYVFALTPDFLAFDSERSSGILPGPKLVEAPAMFARGGVYYAFLGGCTCMGLYGGGVAVLTAARPLGPYTVQSAQLDPGCPMPRQTTCFEMGPGAVCNPVTQAQQNYVAAVPLADGGAQLVWTGDRWQQSPDVRLARAAPLTLPPPPPPSAASHHHAPPWPWERAGNLRRAAPDVAAPVF